MNENNTRLKIAGRRLPVLPPLWALLLTVVFFLLAAPRPAAASCGGNTAVGDATALNNAISAFNSGGSGCDFTITLTADILLSASTPVINNSGAGSQLLINGAGYMVDGQGIAALRPFEVEANTVVVMNQITVTNGMGSGNGGAIAIAEDGILTIQNSTVSSSDAGGAGGGIANSGTLTVANSTISGNQATGFGGGIFNNGTLTVINSTLSGNRLKLTAFNGHALFNENLSNATIINSTIADNEGQVGDALYNLGDLTLQNTILANNTSNDCVSYAGTVTAAYNIIEDTGIHACDLSDGVNGNIIGQAPNLGPLQDNGGPTLTHALLLSSPAINAGNNALAVDGSGAELPYDQRGVGYPRVFGSAVDMGAFEQLCVDPWSLGVSPALVGDEAALNAAITCFNSIEAAGSYTITLTDNISLAASTVTINNDNSTTGAELSIEGNGHTVDGQGLSDVRPFEVAANTVVTLNEITITGGNALEGSGFRNAGFTTIQNSTISDNDGQLIGGGIHNLGTLVIDSSTVSGNTAFFGGGIENWSNMTVTNSTISGNQAEFNGGGINNDGPLTVTNSTISDNQAPSGGGIYTSGALDLKNSVIANSVTGGDCEITGAGTVNAAYSLIEDTGALACNLSDATNGNIIGQDPILGPLQDNGGPTQTMALPPSSPAIDAADDSTCAAAPVNGLDQRGVARSFGLHCDMGAYESAVTQPGPDFVVNTDADSDDGVCDLPGQGLGNQDCTLREAINAANADADVSAITFAGDYTILLLDAQLPAVTTEMTVNGHGPALTIIDGNVSSGNKRAFEVSSTGNLSLQYLTVQGGNCQPRNCAGSEGDRGGGVWNAGTLQVTGSVFANNSGYYAGGIYNSGGTVNITGSTFSRNFGFNGGGGIYNTFGGIATVDGSTFFLNYVANQGGGGAIWNIRGSSLTVVNSTFSFNSGDTFDGGGGINNEATATVINSTFSNNGGGLSAGGIANTGTLSLKNSILANSEFDGFDCTNTGSMSADVNNLIENNSGCGTPVVTADPALGPLQDNGGPTQTMAPGTGSPAIDAADDTTCAAAPVNGLDQRGVVRPQGAGCDIGAVELSCSSLFDVATPQALNWAIGCFNAVTSTGTYSINFSADIGLSTSTRTINNTTAGAALMIDGNGYMLDGQNISGVRPLAIAANTDVTVQNLTVTRGNSPDNGGGIQNAGMLTLLDSTLSENRAYFGGGVHNEVAGTVSIRNSTLSGNVANFGGGVSNVVGMVNITNSTLNGNMGFNGGGVSSNGGTVNITNSTLSGNSGGLSPGGSGGGLDAIGRATVNITNSTLSGNGANFGGGMLINAISSVQINNSIITNSTRGGDCVGGGSFGGSFNLIDDTGGPCAGISLGAITNFDTTLADNGGSTLTHALLAYSNAINAGDDTLAVDESGVALTTDQRGFSRFVGQVDIGAYESDLPPADTTPPVITASLSGTLGDNGWYVSDVTVSFTCADEEGGSGIATDTVTGSTLTGDGANQSVTNSGDCIDNAGNTASSVTVSGINIDKTAPVVSVTGIVDGATYILGDVPAAGCDTQDDLSGVATAASLALSGANPDGSGTITAACTGALDNAGNSGSASATYTVLKQEEAITNIVDDLEGLVDDGVLKKGQANGLIKPLQNAIRSLDKGKTADACNQLVDFIAKVNAKTPSPLDAATAADLIADAQAIQTAVGCP